MALGGAVSMRHENMTGIYSKNAHDGLDIGGKDEGGVTTVVLHVLAGAVVLRYCNGTVRAAPQ